jgi:hypothetical protein
MKRSLYAVLGQIFISASNYAVFVLLARRLPGDGFIGFSTAVGLNMLAFAVAEGGISYVAPRELADRSDPRSVRMAGAFVAISLALYLAATAAGFVLWTAGAPDPLDAVWVAADTLYYAPTLLVPSWVTCWSMDRGGLAALVLARAAVVAAAWAAPGAPALGMAGLFFLAFAGWFLSRLNREERVIACPDMGALRAAVRRLREVFAAKTMAYAVYCLLPLLVGAVRGNAAAAGYVTGERLKSLYSTAFQPLIQTLYLWQFQPRSAVPAGRRLVWTLNLANLAVFAAVLAGVRAGMLRLLGERFAEVAGIGAFAAAAALTVATASLLYLQVFPAGLFSIFHRAALVQMGGFGLLFCLMAFFPSLEPAWVLCGGEALFFLAVLGQVLASGGRTGAPREARA